MAGDFRLERHSFRLQSLRGIAALSVAVGHSFTVMSNGRIEDAHFALRPGNALLAAGEVLVQPNTAVILFYVLSGLVLGESLRRRNAATELRHLCAFAVRRLWRLFAWSCGCRSSLPPLSLYSSGMRRSPAQQGGSTNSCRLPCQPGNPAAKFARTFLFDQQRVVVDPDRARDDRAVAARWCGSAGAPVSRSIAASSSSLYAGRHRVLGNAAEFRAVRLLLLSRRRAAEIVVAFGRRRWLAGNGIGVVLALALLLPVEYLYVSNRLWLPYKFFDRCAGRRLLSSASLLLRPDAAGPVFWIVRLLIWLGDVSYSFYCLRHAGADRRRLGAVDDRAGGFRNVRSRRDGDRDRGRVPLCGDLASARAILLRARRKTVPGHRPRVVKRIERGRPAPAPSFV